MIEITDLVKEYKTDSGKIRALDGVFLSVARGMRIGVLGKNGSGKSTLVRIVGGVETPTQGKVDRKMTVSWPLAFRGGFHPELSGNSNLRFLSRIYDKPFDDMEAFVQDFTELGPRMTDPVYTYSSGMRAKLSFGVSLAFEFDCYLVDEVLAVGDQRFRRKCRAELFEKRRDRALLMVSHQAATIEQSCDMAILIQNGRCVDTFEVGAAKDWKKYARAE